MKIGFQLNRSSLTFAMTIQKNTRKIREEIPNIATLVPGSIFKTYGALCLALEVSAVQGNVKAAQLKEWKRYFEFEIRPGTYKIKIISIYPVIQPKEAGNRKSIYLEDMKLRLLTLIASSNNEAGLIIPRYQLPVTLGLCNDSYNRYKYNLIPVLEKIYYQSNPRSPDSVEIKDGVEFDTPTNFQIWDEAEYYTAFLRESTNIFNGLIKSLLDNLRNNGLITVIETYMIICDGDILSKEATPELKTLIDEVYDKYQYIYSVNGKKNLYLMFNCGRYKKFMADVNKELLTLGIKKHSKVYKFSFISGLDDNARSYRTMLAEGMQALERVNAEIMARFSRTNKEKKIAGILIKNHKNA